MKQRKSSIVNMTVGDPIKLLLVFALPMLVGNVFQQAYNLVDSIIVGKFVGASALAAVGATNSVTFLFFSIVNGIASGSGIVTSQYFGEGDPDNVRRSISNSAYLMLVTSLAMATIAYVAAAPMLRVMGTPADVISDSITYMHIVCLGVPFIGIYNYAASMLRALGDSRTPLIFLIFSCFLNIFMDLLFVCVFGMGVCGAAVATIIAQLISGVTCLGYALKSNPYFKLNRVDLQPDATVMKRAIRLGLPIAMQFAMIAISSTVLQTFVNSFGTAAVAAYTATGRVEQLIHQPYGSLSAALSTYAGQNFGARRMDRVKEGLKKGMLLSAVFSLLMLIVNQTLSRQIMMVFVNDAEVISIGAAALRITSLFYIALATIYMTRAILNGVGDAMFAFINGIVEMAGRIFLPMIFVMIPAIGMWGIWWTTGLTWTLTGLFCLGRYMSWHRRGGER